ncbi:hypothetical protein INT47_001626 [Mucor saturninus]|uniref:GDP/GTP exchange factor Sec2 N-terminal domain-containing protein n=1 Tax=Mucor saturninus TaxID=64648 RepID=A0A8H7RJP7_9FUNG|nr:hypothetical protein INT47_001626 [Mucor saturninus]
MSNEQSVDEQQKRYSNEKPVTTKDIANLYSHLQTMIDNVPKSPRLEIEETTFPITPTCSSSLIPPNRKVTPKEPDCPCHHILVSKDSKYCGLCDDVIPVLSQLQHEVKSSRQEGKKYKESLELEKQNAKTFTVQLNTVENKIVNLNQKLNETNQKYSSLQEDLSVLKNKLVKEKEETERAKEEKRVLENELEDLSQKLFEEANHMVANEKKAKHELEIQYQHLQAELKQCQIQLEAEEEQLKELKNKLGDETTVKQVTTTGAQESLLDIDPMLLSEFKELVDCGPSRKLHTIPFMKNSLLEDIEPCLRFGPSSRLSTKKLCEAISLNACFIEECPQVCPQQPDPLKISALKTTLWERATAISGCQACGRNTETVLPYRFRISVMDDWACIDKFCRDRLVAVCEFYLFVRNTRQGYYHSRTLSDLYNESVQLRLSMFYTRMGTPSPPVTATATATAITATADATPISTEEEETLTDTETVLSSDSSISSNEDDAYFPRHPGNSVWVQHSFL